VELKKLDLNQARTKPTYLIFDKNHMTVRKNRGILKKNKIREKKA